MNYKTAISLFRSRYDRLSILSGKALPKILDTEILLEMSLIQKELQLKYMIVDYNSQSNTIVQTTLSTSTAIYVGGSTVSTVPLDLWQIWNVQINDTTNRTLEAVGKDYMANSVKVTSIPNCYAFYMRGSTPVIELDCYPDSAYLMNISYCPSFEEYLGVGQTGTTWGDVDFTNTTTYGGSLKIPSWEHIIVDGALANATGSADLYQKYLKEVETMLAFQPSNFTGEIPYDSGFNRRNNRYWGLPVGTDLPQYTRYW